MKAINILILLTVGMVLLALIFGFSIHCIAQVPFFDPFFLTLNPFASSVFNPTFALPFVPPLPTFAAPTINPLISPSPYIAPPTFPFRTGAATIVVVPPPAPTVTAYAPLGTLNLTPSTLIFLILYLTLPE